MNTTKSEYCAWKVPGLFKADANEAMKVCEALRQGGGLSPKTLLDASRPEDAVLHGEFEWDDAVAAESYRLSTAGKIIRSIVRVREQTAENTQKVERIISREYFPTHDTADERRGTYECVSVIAKNTDMKARLMNDALKELHWMQNKYSTLKEVVRLLDPPILLLQQALENENAG